jgi:hypothetical protein
MTSNNNNQTPQSRQSTGDVAVFPLLPLVPYVVTFLVGVATGLAVYGLTRKTEDALRTGDFYNSMSPGAQNKFKEQITEINKCTEEVRSAQRRGDAPLETKLRGNLSKLYNDLALTVENDSGNMIRNNPNMAGPSKDFVAATRATAKNVRQRGSSLPDARASNQSSPESSGREIATNTGNSDSSSSAQAADLIKRLNKGNPVGRNNSTAPLLARLQTSNGKLGELTTTETAGKNVSTNVQPTANSKEKRQGMQR